MLIARYKSLQDTRGEVSAIDWETLAMELGRFETRELKGGGLWAPVEIAGPRRDESVKSIHAFVMDFDEGPDWRDFRDCWAEFDFVVHTTHSHTPEKPKWRAIFPLESPVPAHEWKDAYRRFSYALGRGCNDITCSNPSRIFFMPSCPPGSDTFHYRNQGRPLSLTDAAKEEVVSISDSKPGDDFNSRAAWEDVLVPHGWQRVKGNLWVRPGKDKHDGHSAIADKCFYCWSSNAGIPANVGMSKFSLYAHLNFGGDFSAAARELRAKGYGSNSVVRSTDPRTIDAEAEFAASPHSETGNAALFALWASSRLRYVWKWGKWLYWDGSRWKMDEKGGGAAFRLVGEWAMKLRSEAASITDSKERNAAWSFACSLDKRTNILTCLELASKHEALAVLPADLDKEPHLICLLNGVLNLDTGELMPHDQKFMMTKLAPVRYDPNAKCPKWEAFLERFLPDPEIRNYVQKAAGYSLTGYTGERKLFFCYGPLGGNGKSTFFRALARVLGGYCLAASPETFMSQDHRASVSNDIARLSGARMVQAAEQEDGKKLAEGLIKRMTGNDPITARFLHQEYFEFVPQCKLWMMGNHKPVIRGTDDAIWDRIGLIPFDVSLPLEERQPNFFESLLDEMDGIFRWMVEGYAKYLAEGLRAPRAIVEAVKEYRVDSDILGAFLESCTATDEFDSVKSSKLYESYTEWSKQNGHMATSQTLFSKRMKERGIVVRKGALANEFVGLRIVEPT